MVNKHISMAGAALLLAALSVNTMAYTTAPSPYLPEFLERNGCTWQYTWSTGGFWGVSHFYDAVGPCAYSTQQIVWSPHYPSPGTKFYYE
jgi:hypothetical protein